MSLYIDNQLTSISIPTTYSITGTYAINGDPRMNMSSFKSKIAPDGGSGTFNYMAIYCPTTGTSSTNDYLGIFKINQNGSVFARETFESNYSDIAEYFESFSGAAIPIGATVEIVPPDTYTYIVTDENGNPVSQDDLDIATTGTNYLLQHIYYMKRQGYIRESTGSYTFTTENTPSLLSVYSSSTYSIPSGSINTIQFDTINTINTQQNNTSLVYDTINQYFYNTGPSTLRCNISYSLTLQSDTILISPTGQLESYILATGQGLTYGYSFQSNSNLEGLVNASNSISLLVPPQTSFSLNCIHSINSWSATQLTGAFCTVDYIPIYMTGGNPSNIIGVVRPKSGFAKPHVIGNSAWSEWQGKYITDEFGVPQYEAYPHKQWSVGGIFYDYPFDMIPPGTSVPGSAITAYVDKYGNPYMRPKFNPLYQYFYSYQGRLSRPEWYCIGLNGQIPILNSYPVNPNWIKMQRVSPSVNRYYVR